MAISSALVSLHRFRWSTLSSRVVSSGQRLHLTAGRHHSYRGTLTLLGQHMYRAWDDAVKLLRDHDYLDEESAGALRAEMQEGIAGSG